MTRPKPHEKRSVGERRCAREGAVIGYNWTVTLQVALDASGHVFSWGGLGGPTTGHGSVFF